MSLFSIGTGVTDTKYKFKIVKTDSGNFEIHERTSNCFKSWKVVRENNIFSPHVCFEHQDQAVQWIEHEVALREGTVIIKTEYANEELR